MIHNHDNPTRAFLGLPIGTDYSTFIRVDGELQRYTVKAYDHVAALNELKLHSMGMGKAKLSPVLVLLENNSIGVSINNTR